jgi:hypothetical protein
MRWQLRMPTPMIILAGFDGSRSLPEPVVEVGGAIDQPARQL